MGNLESSDGEYSNIFINKITYNEYEPNENRIPGPSLSLKVLMPLFETFNEMKKHNKNVKKITNLCWIFSNNLNITNHTSQY